MSLVLSSADTARLRAASETLLSPLDYASVDAWALEVLRRICELFRCDRAQLLIPCEDGTPMMWTESIRPEALAVLREVFVGAEPGLFVLTVPELNRSHRGCQTAGIRVFNHAIDKRIAGEGPRSPDFGAFLVSEGLAHYHGIRIPMPLGAAVLTIGFSRTADDPFGEENGAELGGLLMPAFSAGTRMMLRLYPTRSAVITAIDALGRAVALIGPGDVELHRSPRLGELLMGDPRAEALVAAMRALARDVLELRSAPMKTSSEGRTNVGARSLPGGRGVYRLRAVFLPPEWEGASPAVLVEVERHGPLLPDIGDLVSRHRLTRREAEVTLLLAVGYSDREIARQLSLSPHTVRKHAEHIFDKLQVHSRKALLLHVSDGLG
jgi:DNA-binding CsgD family transcriptional regulator